MSSGTYIWSWKHEFRTLFPNECFEIMVCVGWCPCVGKRPKLFPKSGFYCFRISPTRDTIIMFWYFRLFYFGTSHMDPNTTHFTFDHWTTGKWLTTKTGNRVPWCIIWIKSWILSSKTIIKCLRGGLIVGGITLDFEHSSWFEPHGSATFVVQVDTH